MGRWVLGCPTDGEYVGECQYHKEEDGTFVLECSSLETVRPCKLEVENMTENKTEKQNDWILIGAGVLGLGTVIATLVDKANLLGNNPTQNWWWERLACKPLEAKIVKEDPNPGPEPRLEPHYTRTPQLRPKYSFSATSYDHVSLEEKARREQFLKATPVAGPEAMRAHAPSLLQRARGSMTYSSGGGRAYGQKELKRIDERITKGG